MPAERTPIKLHGDRPSWGPGGAFFDEWMGLARTACGLRSSWGDHVHDERALLEERLNRTLNERIRPAVYSESAPLELAVWNVPDEPVPVAEALAATYEPGAVGDAWGAPWSTSWFRVTGERPGGVAGRAGRGRARPRLHPPRPRFPVRGPGVPADGTPMKGIEPRNTYLPVDGSRGPASTSRPRPTRRSSTSTRSCRPRSATRRPPAPSRCTRSPGGRPRRLRRRGVAPRAQTSRCSVS